MPLLVQKTTNKKILVNNQVLKIYMDMLLFDDGTWPWGLGAE